MFAALRWKKPLICNVFRAVGPFYTLCRYLGYFPIRLDEGGRLHVFSFAVTILQIGSMIATAAHTVACNKYLSAKHVIQRAVHNWQFVLIMGYNIVSIVERVLWRRSLFELYKEFRRLDLTLTQMGMVIRYDLSSQLLTAFLRGVLYVACFASFLEDHDTEWSTYLIVQVMFAHAVLSHLIRKQFTVLLVVLKKHFIFITDRLESLAKSSIYEDRIGKIECLVEIHQSLCSIGAGANKIFAAHSLAGVTSTFIVLVGNTYEVTNFYVMGSKGMPWTYISKILFWTIFWSVELWEVVHLSKTTRDESIRFTETLYYLVTEDKTKKLSKNKVMSMHMIMGSEVEFTAYDFFPLDYTLIHTMIAATITYLIILIQFS